MVNCERDSEPIKAFCAKRSSSLTLNRITVVLWRVNKIRFACVKSLFSNSAENILITLDVSNLRHVN